MLAQFGTFGDASLDARGTKSMARRLLRLATLEGEEPMIRTTLNLLGALTLVFSALGCSEGDAFPRDPQDFLISFSTGGCYGDCPTFDLEIDDAGHVRYWGTRCVDRFGAFETNVGSDRAAMLYDELARREFFDFVRGEPADCNVADAGGWSWRVAADDAMAQIFLDAGCVDHDPSDPFRALLIDATEAADWIGEPFFNCGWIQPLAQNGTWVVEEDGTPVGILVFEDPPRFRLTDCEQNPIASGKALVKGAGAVLLPDERALMPWLPTAEVHSVSVPRDPMDGASIVVDGLLGEKEQTLRSGNECS